MREIERIERITKIFKKIWLKYPDLRFNQLISSLSWSFANDNEGKHIEYSYSKFENEKGSIYLKDVANVDLFYVEDNDFEEFLIQYLKKAYDYNKYQKPVTIWKVITDKQIKHSHIEDGWKFDSYPKPISEEYTNQKAWRKMNWTSEIGYIALDGKVMTI